MPERRRCAGAREPRGDLVAAQLTRLTCSGRVMCFVGANLLELDVSRRAGAERDGPR